MLEEEFMSLLRLSRRGINVFDEPMLGIIRLCHLLGCWCIQKSMSTTTRTPHAPSEPFPELAKFLEPFHVHFARSEVRHALERYLTGLLNAHPKKNCDTIAQVVPATSERTMQ